MKKYAVIIAAAGRGERFGARESKIFAKIGERPVFIRAIELFINRPDVCQTILAVSPDDAEQVREKYGANLGFMGVKLTEGGSVRCETVRKALSAVREDADYVAVHDAARVCTTTEMIDRVFAEAAKSGAAILAARLTGTIKRLSAAGVVEETVAHDGLLEAQTPQVFRKDIILDAYEKLPEDGQAGDDAEVVAAAGHAVAVAESDLSNLKITYAGDVVLAGAILKSRPQPKPLATRGPFEEAQW